MNRIKFLIYSIILGVTFPVLAQQNNDFLPNIIPPSPTAYELSKYGEIPVGMFTGTPAIDIPLSAYKSKNIEIPIGLSYRSNGIKVDQLSSNTGLGWSLNAGGVVTRIVRDEEDGGGLSLSYPKGEPRGTGGLSSPLVREYFYKAGGYEVDSEPDLYMYNFMGYTGSFVFDDNGEIVMTPIKDLRIEKSEIGFKITNPKGYQYIFQDAELTINRSSGRGHVPLASPKETAWYLSKIIDTKSGHQVNFHYSNQNYSYILSKTDQLKVANGTQNNCPGEGLISGMGHEVLPEITNTLTVAGKKLDSISSTGGEKMTFAYETDHPAVLGYKLATTINMINENDKLIQSFSLKYLKTNNNRVFLKTISFLNPNKRYTFEYNDPEGFAPRLSKAQDHWGYFNGQVNNRYWFPNPRSINNIHLSFNKISIGANKSINSSSAEKGLLRKIIYPSKGYTEFKYEQNSYWDKIIIPPPKSHLTLNVYTDEFFENAKRTHVVHLNNIPKSQKAAFFINVSFNSNTCSEDLLKATAFVSLTNKTTGKGLSLYRETQNGGVNTSGNLFRQSSENQRFYAQLEGGQSYKLELEATYFCTRADMGVTYVDKPPTLRYINISTGGKRIKSILSKASSNTTSELTTYYYGKKETPQKSSGIKGKTPYYYSHTTYRKSCNNNCSYVDVKHILLNSSSLRKLFDSDLSTTYYEYVTISKGGSNFELGGEENEFLVHDDHPGNPLLGNSIQYAPLVNAGWSNGLLKRKLVFKKNELDSFTNLGETHHSYKLDNRLRAKAYGYSILKKFDLICRNNINLDNLDILEYATNSYWFYRNSTIQKTFDLNGNNPIETITNYFYDNSKHKQLTKTETTTSNGKTITKKLYYPDDVISTTSLPGGTLSSSEFNAIKRLQTPSQSNPNAQHRIGEVVQEVTEVKDNITNATSTVLKRSNYANWNDKILPKSVETNKGYGTNLSGFEDRIVYHRYDSHANPLEVSQKDGPHTVYLYGYTQQYPIAKIENATFSEVAKALGVSEAALEGFNKTKLSKINSLRAKKPEWMITTYTHIPLVGMETVTDPKGLTNTYEYDDFNRLKHIKDHNGDILEAYDYNYRNQ